MKYSKGEFIFEKYIYLEEHQLIHRKSLISLAINYEKKVTIFLSRNNDL
jgi:hypothetical protein